MKTVSMVILLVYTLPVFATFEGETIQILRQSGNYEGALQLTRDELGAVGNSPLLLNLLAELELDTGQLASAALHLQQVIDLAAQNLLSAKLNLAMLHRSRGESALALQLLREIALAYTSTREFDAIELYAVARAYQFLAESDPQLFQEAVSIYGEAIEKDPSLFESRIALGELLLEKYNNQEALEVFNEALQLNPHHPRALLGLARSQHFDYSPDAMLSVQQALEINPKLVAARVFLARLYIELDQYELAREQTELALQVNPVSLEALSMMASAFYIDAEVAEYERIEKQVLGLNPHYADFYTTLADLAAQNRLYREAADFAQQAVQLDSQSWRGYGLLGLNQLRLGRMQQGQENLKLSFQGDPYNVWIKNTLQLAATFKNYALVDKDDFQLMLHEKEEPLLHETVYELALDAYQYFSDRYQHEPATPVRIEFYPDHADFSVRSVGLAGVGLLGVCFGPVVVMDSPAARAKGEFNWGSTLWHELAHVFHLSITENRVPRWFSEGLAVYEERSARPGWGADVSPEFLLAYLDGGLLPVSELNNGFLRPSYPEQVSYSYFQAALVFEFIEQRWGFDVIRDSLKSFRNSNDKQNPLLENLKLDANGLDAAFDDYLKNKYAVALDALRKPEITQPAQASTSDEEAPAAPTEIPQNYFEQLELGKLLFEKGDLVLAEPFLKNAQGLFPEYAGGDSSYWLLATLYAQQGNNSEVVHQLEKMIDINAEHYAAHLLLAKTRARRGDFGAAADALQRAIYIYPYELELHRDLASYSATEGNWGAAARARQMLLALDPVDKAEAYYDLAYAYLQAGDRSAARQHVLYALEIAPNFYRAQGLLLSLREAQPVGSEMLNQLQNP